MSILNDSSMTKQRLAQIAQLEKKKTTRYRFRKSMSLYALLLPGALFVLLFSYVPMYGLIIGFKKYNVFLGANPFEAIGLSPWVGLDNWNKLWVQYQFRQSVKNTLTISLLKIAVGFPMPIILALMVNEVRKLRVKRVVQTVIYLPHFVSWVVVSALFMNILGTTGMVNDLIKMLGGTPQKFFMDNGWFPWVLVLTSVWKNAGWGTIVYLAAITGIDPQLYEAAKIDRANRLQQIWYITLPGIANTMVMMLIMRLGSMMNAGFSQIIVMYNPTVYTSGDIIDTFVYREGLGKLNWSTGTMAGMFTSLINMILVLGSNALSRKYAQRGIW